MEDTRAAAGRGRGGVRASVALVAAAAVSVPVIMLFVQLWVVRTADISTAEDERVGVTYLRSLTALLMTLTDAQSASVAGAATDRAAIESAVANVAMAEVNYGSTLGTAERWRQLQDDISVLASQRYAEPLEAYEKYTRLTDATTAMIIKVGERSGLIVDPSIDAHHLSTVTLRALPSLVVESGRLADLTRLATIPLEPATQTVVAGRLYAARALTVRANLELVSSLEAAFTSGEHSGLPAGLLTRLDALTNAVDESAPANSLLIGAKPVTDPGVAAANRTKIRTAAAELHFVLINELDDIIALQSDRADRQRLIAVAPLTLALVLLAGLALAAWLSVLSRRRLQRAAADQPNRSGTTGQARDSRLHPPPGDGAANRVNDPVDGWADKERAGAAR